MFKFQIIIFFKIFSLINAFGQLTILNSPSYLKFDGNYVLNSKFVGDVVSSVLGNIMSTDMSWPALTITNPFNLPERVIVIYVPGIEQINYNQSLKTYTISGDHTLKSMAALSSELLVDASNICDFNLDEFDESELNFESLFGVEAILQGTEENKSLKAAFIESLTENWYKIQDECKLLWVHTTNTSNVAQDIAVALMKFNEAVQSNDPNTLFFVITEKKQRFKRSTQEDDNNSQETAPSPESTSLPEQEDDDNSQETPPSPNHVLDEEAQKDANIADFLSFDETIIVLLMVLIILGVSFLTYAVCLMLVSIDPGKNSIAYRLTEASIVKVH